MFFNFRRLQFNKSIIGLFLLLITQFVSCKESYEYCEGETMSARCPQRHVLLMNIAEYGQMRIGGCLDRNYGQPSCSNDVIDVLDNHCSGKTSCQVRVSSLIDEIKDRNNCDKGLRSYLKAIYSCVKVFTPKLVDCVMTDHVMTTKSRGWLTGTTLQECAGDDAVPWILTTGQGQRLHLELYDFSPQVNDLQLSPCNVIFTIIDSNGETTTICQGKSRRKNIFTSSGNRIEIRLSTIPTHFKQRFMLKYTSEGCETMPAPIGGWIQTFHDKAIIGCNSTSNRWRLNCINKQWSGAFGNCTILPFAVGERQNALTSLTQSQWASIIIIIVIALTLSSAIFLFGLIFLRRKRNSDQCTNGYGYNTECSGREVTQYLDNYCREQNVRNSPKVNVPITDGYASSENDYYRTWQLQRHGNKIPGQRLVAVAAPQLPGQIIPQQTCHNCSTIQRPKSYQSEHIYESPKFPRKNDHLPKLPDTDESQPIRIQSQYFELDPDVPEV